MRRLNYESTEVEITYGDMDIIFLYLTSGENDYY